jgi:hypothetical protein
MPGIVDQLQELAGNLEQLAGVQVRSQVMEGIENIKAGTDRTDVALWIKGAMERLDALIGEPAGRRVMERCGMSCARVNGRVVQQIASRRRQHQTVDSFLEAEQRKPMPGTRLVRKGNTLHQFFTPRSFRRPMRCYCALLRSLPEGETVSPTYCHCSTGFLKTLWEAALERPVTVELIRSAVSGAEECEFSIRF